MTSNLCCRCHREPRKSKQGYCVACYRTYQREWAQRNRGQKPRPIKPVLPPGFKFCPRCERSLPVERFSRCQSKSDGRMSHCKECDYMKQLRWREKNSARIRVRDRDYQRKWRAANPGYNAAASRRSKRRRIARKFREVAKS